MSLVTKKEFGELCGLPTNRLSVEIKRGKVAMTGDKIDTEIPINRDFMTKYREKRGGGSGPGIGSSEAPAPMTDQEVEGALASLDLKNIDNIKKIEETKRIVVDTRLKLLQEKQRRGENIPTETVKMIVMQLAKSFTAKFHIACDNFLMEIGKRKSLSRAEMAELREALIAVVNEGTNTAVDEAKRSINILAKQTAVKKGVGEHG